MIPLHRPRRAGRTEKAFVDIGGVRQGMFIDGGPRDGPVLLYLHGGLPEYFLTERYPTGLAEDFTVVWWEQRGAGLSAGPDVPPASITAEQLITDTLSVTDHLRARFGQERIYLMAHSGGSFIGVQAACRAPDRYAAYLGVAQMVRQLESEEEAYAYLLERFEERGDRRMVRRLRSAPVTRTRGTPLAYLAVRDTAMHRLGVGTTRDMRSVLTGVVWPSLRSRQYTPREKVRLWRAKHSAGVSPVWRDMLATDLEAGIRELPLPLYLFHGVHDRTCSYRLARDWFAQVRAPVKGFYTFDRSAHSPVFEEPDRVRRILREDVLRGTTSLADPSPAA